jgi:hypothetical protein
MQPAVHAAMPAAGLTLQLQPSADVILDQRLDANHPDLDGSHILAGDLRAHNNSSSGTSISSLLPFESNGDH